MNFKRISKYLNTVSCLSLLVVLIPLLFVLSGMSTSELPSQESIIESNKSLPDIYYLIFDGHASFSTLETLYDFNNTEFKDYLVNKGFFIPSQTQSNYPHTGQSLASSLNMKYIHNEIYDPNQLSILSEKNADAEIRTLLKYNKVSEILKLAGYRVIQFSSYIVDENMYADSVVRYNPLGLNDFNLYLIESSWLRHLFKTFLIDKFRRGNVLFLFENLKKIKLDDQPIFVFMHFISPHPPFLFDREGNLPKIDEYAKTVGLENEWLPKEKYVDQLVFIDNQIKESVDYLLNDSKRKSIIILQSDHGPKAIYSHENPTKTKEGLQERFSIFNAYYFPLGGSEKLYDTITPVNSFRLLFNYYLGTNYSLLEDESYFPINISSNVFSTFKN